MKKSVAAKLLSLWICWVLVMIGFQWLVSWRVDLKAPDYALEWTQAETRPHSQDRKPYLNDPFMNNQVCWDSEYYLSQAVGGFDDPAVQAIDGAAGGDVSLNYAFFPLYSVLIKGLMVPLSIFKLTPIAAATLGGVLIAVLGTLMGMFALFDLTRDYLGEDGAFRTVFYMLIFPSGFFLAQVYTEGLFIGLTFGALALANRKKMLFAAILAAAAVWTRAAGAVLALPIGLYALRHFYTGKITGYFKPKAIFAGLMALVPVASYFVWSRTELAASFHFVEKYYFGRGVFVFEPSMNGWKTAFESIFGTVHQTSIYYGIEFGIIGLGLAACFFCLRRYPAASLYSLLVWSVSFFSGGPQSMTRYVLTLPVVYIMLGKLGKNQVFDRVWTTVSILLLGLLAMLFTFNFWVA